MRTKNRPSSPIDASRFVVIGEALAAGVSHFGLSADVQPWSFPAQLAGQLGVDFRQPLIEPPGLGGVIGQRELPLLVPDLLQTTVRRDFPPAAADLSNLSVPGFTLEDALCRRPRPPLVERDDASQTLANFILGLPALLRSGEGAPTQVEYACARQPSLVLIELGFHEVLAAAIAGMSSQLPEAAAFGERYRELLHALGDTRIVVTTVPDPLDTAFFSTLDVAAGIACTEASFLEEHFGLASDDRIALPGLLEIGYQLTGRAITGQLPAGSVLPASVAAEISQRVAALNGSIRSMAEAHGALVYDLHGFFQGFAQQGATVGDHELSAEYLGRFYLLNGIYPGRTGHALIANDLIDCLREAGVDCPLVDVAAVAADDANLLSRRAPGGPFTKEFLTPRSPRDLPTPPPIDPATIQISPIQTTYPGTPFDPGGFKAKAGCQPAVGVHAGGLSDPHLEKPLELPEGLQQTLDLNPRSSYFGDALRAVDAPDDKPFLTLPNGFGVYFGASGNTLFGGLAMTDSRLHGKVHLKFSEPDSEGRSRFEITHPGGLTGEDGVLAAPQLFKLPSHLNLVRDVPGLVSSGVLDLKTGIVFDLHYNTLFFNTAIQSLFAANPGLPKAPFTFPGFPNSGSTWARFEQRPDGLLDFTLGADMIQPTGLEAGGEPIRFPLPFGTPDMECASIVTRGLTLHPHIHLTTREDLGEVPEETRPEIPENTVCELSPFVHNTSFGDVFGLHIDELGGEGTGRSHLMGRLRVQFGQRFGDSVSMALCFLPPGGLLNDAPQPLPLHPPGTGRGLVGFDEELRFPRATYPQSGLACANDANNLTVGAVDLATGQVTGELLRRSWVVQKLFMALIQAEPCTPGDSFLYLGPASFERGVGGGFVLRYNGEVTLPFPKGFKFPSPDGSQAWEVVQTSPLDPFLRLQAMTEVEGVEGVLQGGERLTSSIGDEFSYEYAIPCQPTDQAATFRYTNHSRGGTFELTTLSWVSFTNARGSCSQAGEADTVTFGGFGTWSEDEGGIHQVSVHISTAADASYVGIQVDGGVTSNVNTKPERIEGTRA
ncbi:MAG: hypothetical protein AAF657_11230 [Acidobacteriota bacterium]